MQIVSIRLICASLILIGIAIFIYYSVIQGESMYIVPRPSGVGASRRTPHDIRARNSTREMLNWGVEWRFCAGRGIYAYRLYVQVMRESAEGMWEDESARDTYILDTANALCDKYVISEIGKEADGKLQVSDDGVVG